MLRSGSRRLVLAILALFVGALPGCFGSAPPRQLKAGSLPASPPEQDSAAPEAYSETERASGAPSEDAAAESNYRVRPTAPGLGTTWGERRNSQVQEVSFIRDAPSRPFETVTFHYNDEDGIIQATGSVGRNAFPGVVAVQGGAVEVSLVEPDDDPLPLLTANGRHYVVGEHGDRYVIRIQNFTPGRFEVVASVDGLDALDGSAAGFHKRGYLIEPWGTLRIEGFRESDETVRAFRFGELQESYAVRRGRGRNVGVVGIALFQERGFRWGRDDSEMWRRDTAVPFPGKYAPPPAY